MAYIDLRDGGRSLGRFELPKEVISEDNHHFPIFKVLSQGGNGVIFESRKLNERGGLINTCALKFLKQQDSVRKDRFSNEVRILRELDHERITRFYGEGSIKVGQYNVPWVALEFGGENLRQYIEQRGIIKTPVLIQIVSQMCDALNHLHEKGFIHRDVKPENFVWEAESNESIMMIDFGIAKRVHEDVSTRPLDNFTQHLEFVGPVFFSSPELISYARDKSASVDSRSDLFQLGKVIWYLATGKISAGIPSRKDCPLGGRLHDIVIQLLQDDPEDRLQSSIVVKKAILNLI